MGREPQRAEYSQPQKQFEEAVDNDSTNDSFVLVRVADKSSGVAKTGCIEANLLLGAIHIENGLDYDASGMKRARELALSADGHRFAFSNPAALSNVGYQTLGSTNEEACEIIRGGRGAYRNDMSGQIVPEASND